MKHSLLLATLTLAGCAFSPEHMATRSNWDVCRFTMGGPHANVAQDEAQRRGLDCQPLYPAIAAQSQNQNAATANFINALNPPKPAPVYRPAQQTHCTSTRSGDTVQTHCR